MKQNKSIKNKEYGNEVQIQQRKILIPIDGSSYSKQSFLWYVNHVKRDNDHVIFVHIIEPKLTTALSGLAVEFGNMSSGSTFRISEENLQKGKSLCQDLLNEANRYHVTAQALLQVDTKPGPAIVKMIDEHKINFVIMSNRGQGLISRTFLGSVSAYILHHARVPVSILPPINED